MIITGDSTLRRIYIESLELTYTAKALPSVFKGKYWTDNETVANKMNCLLSVEKHKKSNKNFEPVKDDAGLNHFFKIIGADKKFTSQFKGFYDLEKILMEYRKYQYDDKYVFKITQKDNVFNVINNLLAGKPTAIFPNFMELFISQFLTLSRIHDYRPSILIDDTAYVKEISDYRLRQLKDLRISEKRFSHLNNVIIDYTQLKEIPCDYYWSARILKDFNE